MSGKQTIDKIGCQLPAVKIYNKDLKYDTMLLHINNYKIGNQ